MEALDIHSVYMAEINKVASNTREPIHCDTSNPFDLCGNTGHTFDYCEILKKLLEKRIYPIFTMQSFHWYES